jgi:metal-responsive CopG/Arc/MetJ family transcriptional regulator
MTTAQIMKTTTVNVGIRISQHVLDKLDKHKGYYSRNRYLCKILDDYTTQLEREEESNNKK